MTNDDPGTLLRTVTAALEGASIPHMVVGSFASTVHGKPRTTQDLDIVIDPTQETLDRFLGALDLDQFYVDADVARDALRRRSMFNLIEMNTAWKVDLVIRKNRPFSVLELQRRIVLPIADVDVPTATAEDTIIAKLEWAKLGASERQLIDVAGILRVRAGALDFAYIEHWVEQLHLQESWSRARALTT
jgi:acetolactate synthase regulatory subunit